jgi:hypothetical protein
MFRLLLSSQNPILKLKHPVWFCLWTMLIKNWTHVLWIWIIIKYLKYELDTNNCHCHCHVKVAPTCMAIAIFTRKSLVYANWFLSSIHNLQLSLSASSFVHVIFYLPQWELGRINNHRPWEIPKTQFTS